MSGKVNLGLPRQMYLEPLISGLEKESSGFTIVNDVPGSLAVKFRDHPAGLRCSFLTPFDYARYGGEYRIIPGVAVSSEVPTGTIRLYVKEDVRNIKSVAVDVRVTSEIVLMSILLRERLRSDSADGKQPTIIPMMPDIQAMLKKADAALVVNFSPEEFSSADFFSLDLVEEWNDMTGLPYLHGFWVGREESLTDGLVLKIMKAGVRGAEHIHAVAARAAKIYSVPPDGSEAYFSKFSYVMGDAQMAALDEIIRFGFMYGMIGDIPELNFYEPDLAADAGSL